MRWSMDKTFTGATNNPSIHLLLRNLFENSYFRTLVKRIEFKGTKNFGRPRSKRSPVTVWPRGVSLKLSGSELKAIKQYICTTQLPSEVLWIAQVEIGNINVSLILSTLTALESPHLDFNFHTDTKFLNLLCKHVIYSVSGQLSRIPFANCDL